MHEQEHFRLRKQQIEGWLKKPAERVKSVYFKGTIKSVYSPIQFLFNQDLYKHGCNKKGDAVLGVEEGKARLYLI